MATIIHGATTIINSAPTSSNVTINGEPFTGNVDLVKYNKFIEKVELPYDAETGMSLVYHNDTIHVIGGINGEVVYDVVDNYKSLLDIVTK